MPALRGSLQNALGAKYRIVRELSGGGMSRVFLAEERELEREVAIKILPPDLLDETLVARFRREVLQTARLQHPAIVPLLDAGTFNDDDGRDIPYYVMQYVRGETLRSRLLHEGHLSVNSATRVLRNVLEALVHAHAHGVVHRDIKPENIFLSGASAVVGDFGVALVREHTRDARSPAITTPGTTVGTPTYMAPEQIAGDGDIDHRADLYAVGVLAYEMLVGKPPGEGRTSREMLASRAREKRTPLRTLRSDVPPLLEAVIDQCLRWDPSSRPASALDVLRVIEAVGVTPATPTSLTTERGVRPAWRSRRRSLVGGVSAIVVALLALTAWRVLGRESRHQNARLAVLFPELRVVAGALHVDEQFFHLLLSNLRPISGLDLLQEVSVSQMHDHGLTATQMAESLRVTGVDSALSVQLHPATDGSSLLSIELVRLADRGRGETVAGPIPIASLDRVQPDSLQTLVRMLSAQVAARLALTSSNRSVAQPYLIDAFMAWSKGRDAYAKRTPAAMREAVGYFERAIALDTLYAQAYQELASTLALALFYHYALDEPPNAIAVRALRLVNRAIELQPTFADAYAARGYLESVIGAPVEVVERDYREAQRLRPTNPFAQLWFIGLASSRGQFDLALRDVQEEIRKDPRSPAARVALPLYALAAGDYLSAIRGVADMRVIQQGIPVAAQLELWAWNLLGGRGASECVNVAAGPYLGAAALCLERARRLPQATMLSDSLFRIATGKAHGDSTFDLALYLGEMAMYTAARNEPSSARLWLRQAFTESPAGVDLRLRHAVLGRPFEGIADSLRADAWQRVLNAARRDAGEPFLRRNQRARESD